jgi:hypothetical protein
MNSNLWKEEAVLKKKLQYITSKCLPVEEYPALPMWIIVMELEEALKIAKKLAEEDAIAQDKFYSEPIYGA